MVASSIKVFGLTEGDISKKLTRGFINLYSASAKNI